MKIAFKHSAVVPVKTYGGTERVLYWLMKELVQMGHEVTLLGPTGCDVMSIGVKYQTHSSKISHDRFDVVHYFEPVAELPKDVPALITIHGNGKPGEVFHDNTVFLSKRHAQNHNATCYVYNGIDFSYYPFQKTKSTSWDNFLFLAKAKWKVKNLKDCVRVCKKNKKDLYIAGGRAITFSKKIHSMGMVTDIQKMELLKKCDALLFPVRWHEPFGIAILEAYSQGLPVISSNHGSLLELVNDKTGIVCSNYKEFDEAVARGKNTFDAGSIRKYAEENFSSRKMAETYLALYKRVIAGEKLNKEQPRYLGEEHPEKLLDF
jgi:glycosyltransferase involved in cell wall biosynthesis